MSDPVYKRILIKISGEALAGDKKTGFEFDFISKVCDTVNKCTAMGVEVGIVVGGGIFWRGVKDGAGHVERVSADRMGMLATAMNCLAFADVLRQCGGEAKVLTAVDIQGVGERYDTRKAIEYMEDGNIVLFAGGSGETPYGRYFHIAVKCDNCDEAYAVALAAGARSKIAPKDVDIPSQPSVYPVRIAFVFGPNDEEIELFEVRQ